jgi:type I restriction enzyme S subunit
MLLAMLDVPLPPMPEQRRIVAEVEALLSQVDACGTTLSNTVRHCARLRQAILKWAFEGKLVDQDSTDEPADKLLARIRQGHPAVGPVKKVRGRRAKGAA